MFSFKGARYILALGVCLVCTCCNKDDSIKRYSYLQVRFEYDVYPIPIERINGSWNYNSHTAELTATGYKNERFRLQLHAVVDTGNVQSPSISDIFFTDGLDFVPDSVNRGYVHIAYLDTTMISGDFKVSFHDDFNGTENKIVVGKFGINIH